MHFNFQMKCLNWLTNRMNFMPMLLRMDNKYAEAFFFFWILHLLHIEFSYCIFSFQVWLFRKRQSCREILPRDKKVLSKSKGWITAARLLRDSTENFWSSTVSYWLCNTGNLSTLVSLVNHHFHVRAHSHTAG